MNTRRFIGIIIVFAAATVAWFVLSSTVSTRTDELDKSLSAQMQGQWGPDIVAQASPYLADAAGDARGTVGTQPPAGSKITAGITHEDRNKGLLWFSTFTVKFKGEFTVPSRPLTGTTGTAPAEQTTASAKAASPTYLIIPLPADVTGYDQLQVIVDGKDCPLPPSWLSSHRLALPLAREAKHEVIVSYTTFGQKSWLYMPSDAAQAQQAPNSADSEWRSSRYGDDKSGPTYTASTNLWQLSNFDLTITTDFDEIDYPKGSRSPSDPAAHTDSGMQARWTYANAMMAQPMGIVVPQKVNAGPIAARMSFFAPVSLFFFFAVLFVLVVLKGIRLHPVHYLFLAAGFFAFHILMAYLADVVNIHAAFWICSAVSVLLVVSYLRLIGGVRFAVFYAGTAQLVFLVGFSYAFFWVGKTGLAITVGAVLTLFILMQATGRVNWHDVFRPRQPPSSEPKTQDMGLPSVDLAGKHRDTTSMTPGDIL